MDRLPRVWWAAVVVCLSLAGKGHAQSALDFAVFAGNDITFNAYSNILGDIYAGEDIELDHSYSLYGPEQSAGDLYAGDSVWVGSSSTIYGSIYANGNVTLDGEPPWIEVTGQIVNGPGTVPSIDLPPAAVFTAGGPNVSSDEDWVLLPGTYGTVVHDGLFNDLHLYSGDYYMDSLTIGSSTSVHLHLDDGPLRVHSKFDIRFDSGTDFYVNGFQVIDDGSPFDESLAADVLWEAQHDIVVDAGFLNYFYGTMFAPQGDITAEMDFMVGSMIAGDNIEGDITLKHVPSAVLAARSLTLAGDYNEDGIVDAADYTVWRDQLGSATALPNDDTPGVGADDYDRWKTHYGEAAANAVSIVSVPEPAAALLLAGGLVWLAGRARRQRTARRAS